MCVAILLFMFFAAPEDAAAAFAAPQFALPRGTHGTRPRMQQWQRVKMDGVPLPFHYGLGLLSLSLYIGDFTGRHLSSFFGHAGATFGFYSIAGSVAGLISRGCDFQAHASA